MAAGSLPNFEKVEVEGPMTCGCFSGLCATAVPVRLGSTTVGVLKTGQVFRRHRLSGRIPIALLVQPLLFQNYGLLSE